MKLLPTIVFCALCASCASLPKVPVTVPVTVTKFRPLPEWSKEKEPLPVLKDGTVESHLVREGALEQIVRIYWCKVDLLIQLDLGQKVDTGLCKTP